MRNLTRNELKVLQGSICEEMTSFGAFDELTKHLSYQQQDAVLEKLSKDYTPHSSSDDIDRHWEKILEEYDANAFDQACDVLSDRELQACLESICDDYELTNSVDIIGGTFEEFSIIGDGFLDDLYQEIDKEVKLETFLDEAVNNSEFYKDHCCSYGNYRIKNVSFSAGCERDICESVEIGLSLVEYERNKIVDQIGTRIVISDEIPYREPTTKEIATVAGIIGKSLRESSIYNDNVKIHGALKDEAKEVLANFFTDLGEAIDKAGRSAYIEACNEQTKEMR